MSDDRYTPQGGAPSDDTTSALFVSARKKQLEQQEADRRAKEKEQQRLAAEAEVQRLEREVEERRRRAEEEKRLAEEDAQRIAEEAKAKKTMAANDPNAFLVTQSNPLRAPSQKAQSAPFASSSSSPPGGIVAGLLSNKKMLLIIGGAAVAVIALVVVLIVTLSGGGGVAVDPNMELSLSFNDYSISLNYPEKWDAFVEEDPPRVYVQSDYDFNGHCDTLMFKDVTWEYYGYLYDDFDPLLAGIWMLEDSIKEFIGGGSYDEFIPETLSETRDGLLVGGTELRCVTGGGENVHLYLEFIPTNDQLLLAVIGMPERKKGFDDALVLCRRIAATAKLESYQAYDDEPTYSEPQVYYDLNSGIYFEYPDGWYVAQASGASTFYAPVLIKESPDAFNRMVVYNYTPEFNDFVQSGNSGMDYLIDDFAYWFLGDAGYDYYDMYNVAFSDQIYFGIHEMILLEMENDEAYFYFNLIKILSDPQQVAATVIETSSIDARDDFDIIFYSLDLR